MMSGGFGMGWGNGWTGFAMIPMFLWWALIIALVVIFVKWLISRRDETNRAPASHALEILAERYARGEIRKDEFDAMRRDLAG
jgi:putative membrane protein